MRAFRATMGLALWIAAGVALWWYGSHGDAGAAGEAAPRLWNYATGQRRTVALKVSPPVRLAVGDPVFADGEDGPVQIGEIREVSDPRTGFPVREAFATSGQVLLYPAAPEVDASMGLTYYVTPDSMEWVLKTMLPAEKREQIAAELKSAFEAHHEEIVEALRPIVIASLRDAVVVLEEDVGKAISRRRGELEALGARYQQEVVQEEIVPLVKEEVWPVVRRRAEPLADEVGREIWRRVSLWRFGWRFVYDKTPLAPEKKLVKKEWKRFVDEEATPVLEEHAEEFVDTTREILAEVARNEKIRETLRKNLAKMIDDPELQRIVGGVIREAVVENPRLHGVLKKHWTGPEAQRAFRLASQRLEGTAERIVNLVFGSPDLGITPEFARVVRAQALGKDRRWLVLQPATERAMAGDGASGGRTLVLPVRRGGEPEWNPFVPTDG